MADENTAKQSAIPAVSGGMAAGTIMSVLFMAMLKHRFRVELDQLEATAVTAGLNALMVWLGKVLDERRRRQIGLINYAKEFWVGPAHNNGM